MAFLDTQDKQKINDRITEIERQTRGEIVTVIAQRSDDYAFIPLLWAAWLALVVPASYYFASIYLPFRWNHVPTLPEILALQCLLFVLLSIVLRLPVLTRILVPRAVLHHRARMMAHHQFLEQRVHHTPHRVGLLLFVSVTEHFVSVIPDQALCATTEANQWQKVVELFTAQLRQGHVNAGFQQALDECERILALALPQEADTDAQSNYLDNHLIEI